MRKSLLTILLTVFVVSLHAQKDSVSHVRQGIQSSAYLTGGLMGLGTDLSNPTFEGFDVGLGHQSRLSRLFFLRYGVRFGYESKVDDTEIRTEARGLNSVLADLGYGEGTPFVRNYSSSQIGAEVLLGFNLLTIGNDNHYLSIYPVVGFNVFQQWVSYNALDGSEQLYDFSNIDFTSGDLEEELDELLDNTYETNSPHNGVNFMAVGGAGIRYQMTPSFGIGAEYRTAFSFTDVLDGYEANDRNDGASWIQLQLYFPL